VGVVIEASDIIVIHQLLGRYGHTLDARDWAAFGELFVADAAIDYRSANGNAVVRNGRGAIVDWFREVDVSHPAAHLVTNIVVDDRADPSGPVPVHSKFIVPFTRPDHVPVRLYGGDYHDVVVRTEQGWRFAHKQCLPRWQLSPEIDHTVAEHRRTY
jgi:3-phenylpropionate/cinnamic acid dioxygenase small subunit